MARQKGFTLIELSIVLLIIGLLTGGVLVGRDLVKSAAERAQISQIEKYNQAVLAFTGKFNSLPGDMTYAIAAKYDFIPGSGCTGSQGQRDGNGLIEGFSSPSTVGFQGVNEPGYFWVDLSSPAAGGLIEGSFPSGGAAAILCTGVTPPFSTTLGTDYIGNYLPPAKIGQGNFVYVYSTGGANWYGVSAVKDTPAGPMQSNAQIPVIQAYNIDKKIDDGLPTTGSVKAAFLDQAFSVQLPSSAGTDSTTTCYNTTSNAYSVSSIANYGAGGNCALSFQFPPL